MSADEAQGGEAAPRLAFARALRRYRRAAGLTQEELAERAGLAPLTIRNAEAGRRTPQRQNFLDLAAALGLTPDQTPGEFAAFEAAWREQRAVTTGLASAPPPRPVQTPAGTETGTETVATAPHNLPADVTSFVGRAAESGDLAALLRRPGVRLVTLTGPGGSGKTRLALRVARLLLDDFPDGVWFVGLAPLTDPALVLHALARTLGLREAPWEPLGQRLRDHLAPRRTLLLLDNFERLLDAAPAVTALLRDAPDLTLLVTSRVRLHAYGEHERGVEPLPTPPPGATPAAVADSPAGALFVARAAAVQPAFALDERNAAAVAELCARLDGLPLAIELAAARVRDLPPAALLARFPGRLDLGADGPRDAPARQRALRATLAWSHDLLDPDARALFARLAVFAGGWTAAAAAMVCGDLGARAVDVPAGLAALRDGHLIAPTTDAGEPRYGMLETVREYAVERLGASGEEKEARQRHAAWLATLARYPGRYVPGALLPVDWLDRLEREHDNLRAALGWALDGRRIERAAQLAGGAWIFWHERLHFAEGDRWLRAILARGGDLPAGQRAPLLAGAVVIAFSVGEYARAAAVGEEAAAALRALGEEWDLAIVRTYQALASQNRGDPASAERHFAASLAGWRRLGAAHGVMNALSHLAFMRCQYGRFAEAEPVFAEALALAEAHGDHATITRHDIDHGLSLMLQGRFADARASIGRGVAAARELALPHHVSMGLIYLGLATLLDGAPAEAAGYLAEALRQRREAGEQFGVVYALIGLAGVAARTGGAARAARLCGAATTLAARLGASLAPAPAALYERELAAVRAQLTPEAFAAAWAAGQAMPPEQAIAEALDEEAR